jgi:hypothetical protein
MTKNNITIEDITTTNATIIDPANVSCSDGTYTTNINQLQVTCGDGINGSSVSASSMTCSDGTNNSSMYATSMNYSVGANSSSMTATSMTCNNGIASFTQMDNLYLQFINHLNGGNLKIGIHVGGTNNHIINTDNSDLFINSQTKQFFKFNDVGYSYKPILAVQNQLIQRYMNYIVFDDGINNVDINTYTSLLDSDATLPDEERVGWSCKFANLNGVDVTISNMDGIQFFSHYGGTSSSPYQLKKFSVVEVTLIWSKNLGQYFYAVSQYN